HFPIRLSSLSVALLQCCSQHTHLRVARKKPQEQQRDHETERTRPPSPGHFRFLGSEIDSIGGVATKDSMDVNRGVARREINLAPSNMRTPEFHGVSATMV